LEFEIFRIVVLLLAVQLLCLSFALCRFLQTRSPTMTTMMKAAAYRQFSGPIRIENVPSPSCPEHGVVVQVCAAGVCRSDWHGWKGHDSDIHRLPFVPGHTSSAAWWHT
jgi:hypothetical protein